LGPVGGDVDLVDAILRAFSLSRNVPDARQHVDVGQFADSEAPPILRRSVWPQRLVARAVELIPEDVCLTHLGSEKDRTENSQLALVPRAEAVALEYGVSDQVVVRFGFG
jgi:hypothetical protein